MDFFFMIVKHQPTIGQISGTNEQISGINGKWDESWSKNATEIICKQDEQLQSIAIDQDSGGKYL